MSKKVTLNQLVEELSDEAVIPKVRSQEFINAFLEHALDEINEKGKAAITNFGSFTIVDVAERIGVNPKSGEPLVIPAHKRISFTPYKALEKRVNRDYDHLEAEVVETPTKKFDPKEKESTEAERLFDALTGGLDEDIDPSLRASYNDDPFNFEDEEAMQDDAESDEIESALEEVLEEDDHQEEDVIPELEPETDSEEDEIPELELESDFEEDEEDAFAVEDEIESNKSARPIRTPGLPKRNSNALSPTVLLSILGVFLISMLAIWFFFFRSDTTPVTASTESESILNDPSAFENDQVLNEVNDASATSSESSSSDQTMESQIIPLAAPEVDVTENQGELMTIENQEPQIEYERFTGISYSVSAGVWIYEIARQTYGNTRLWPLIFQANYTLANNPDLILPNVELNVPQLEGTADNPSSADYVRLAEAARYVAQAYENAGNTAQAAAYIKAANWYETMQ